MDPADVERECPEYWRYWRDLPPHGSIGLFLRAWYSQPFLERAYDKISQAEFDDRLSRVVTFENELLDDGACILKFWLHLGHDVQKRRLKKLEGDPLTKWRVTPQDWKHWEMYDKFIATAERLIMRTSTGRAPWNIVEGTDARFRCLTVGNQIRDTLGRHIAEWRARDEQIRARAQSRSSPAAGKTTQADSPEAQEQVVDAAPADTAIADTAITILDTLDMSQKLTKLDYGRQKKKLQAKLNQLQRAAFNKGISTILVFEGVDAAGKGGDIRRITAALDARHYQVIPIAAPTDEEKAHHYLWRFWRNLSRSGRITIFDRSWYGRVLVERVERFAAEDEWRRAYAEINDFEEQLTEHGTVLLKFWVHITKDEQLARFKAREETPYKRWKLTDEDWRNRDKWVDYELAVNDMVQYTGTSSAPWILVEGNDKRSARIKVLKTVCGHLQRALQRKTKGAA
jgi:polyphosphate kinase 2 (PPK2 family)